MESHNTFLEASIVEQSILSTPLSELTKSVIISHFWGCAANSTTGQRLGSPNVGAMDLDVYWAYYTKECANALHDSGRHVATRTHADILDCVAKLRTDMRRDHIKSALRSKLTSHHANEDEMLENSVDLAASLLLIANFGCRSYGFSGQSSVRWTKGSLREFLQRYFEPERKLGESVKLEKIFKASNLDRIAGLEIVWTDNLADHLRLTDDDKRVHIFHHASFLEVQREGAENVLPEGLAEETLRTLALLCPASDHETRQWISGLPDHGRLDKRVNQCGRLKTDSRRIDRFAFWRDRLVMLKQAFDEAQPKTMRQWWYDSRNGVQWYTFWVAVMVLVLTVVFGLVQSIEGALQVYASFKSLDSPG